MAASYADQASTLAVTLPDQTLAFLQAVWSALPPGDL